MTSDPLHACCYFLCWWGIPDMVTHKKKGLLYRFEKVEILTEHIRSIFSNDSLANKLSSKGIMVAEERHHRVINLTNI